VRSLIPHYLAHQAGSRPDAMALECLSETLSYGELSSKVNRFANCLKSLGVERGDRVGIHMDKCIAAIIALHGIMQAGAVYVPLDPMAPPDRVAAMIEDCGINVLVSGESKRGNLLKIAPCLTNPLTVVGVDGGEHDPYKSVGWQKIFEDYSEVAPEIKLVETDLAYIIHTSGSTGKPKGIMHTHYSSLSYSRWAVSEYKLGENDRLGNHSPLHFDLSIFDFIAGLIAGACTVIIPDEYTRFPASYSQLIQDSKITVLFTVPFALIQLSLRGILEQRNLSRLRLIIFAGEPMAIKYLRELQQQLPDVCFDNMYGPAEVNGVSHYGVPVLTPSEEAIPIGPISQIAEARVVDENLSVVAPGEPGELLVRTPTMMVGYWHRPDLNKKAFYYVGSHDHTTEQRFYRTGDLVREDKGGTLWFLGRRDRQVKVRGYRVELDEIEAVLVAHPGVEEAAAYVIKTVEGVSEIQTAVIFGEPLETTEILMYLKQKLPNYALPTSINALENFPRTATGKVDKLALSQAGKK
jgi:L-proline---[L-prolyl-carrier protein] ligase